MAAAPQVEDDTSQTLAQLRAASGQPLALKLIDIAKHQKLRSIEWSQSLECLRLVDSDSHDSKRQRGANGNAKRVHNKPLLERREVIDGWYIAVSYTWTPSSSEDTSQGGYLVESRERGCPVKSRVRDVVLDRALQVGDHFGCKNIWIDKECIDQDDEVVKERLIQSMDLVYSRSAWSVALLSCRIETEQQLDLLAKLLKGLFVKKGDVSQSYNFQLAPSLVTQAPDLLQLLDSIISDPWWTRAWTFQEDYKSSSHMLLLVPCTKVMMKPEFLHTFGEMCGQLKIDSIKFRKTATEFCQAYRSNIDDGAEICEKIMNRAARYNILLQEPGPEGRTISRSMSPRIFQDVGRRDIEIVSDRLAIAANCCQYSLRFDTVQLAAENTSLSLAMLSLYLLNGEILHNDEMVAEGTLSGDIFSFLRRESLNSVHMSVVRQLTFLKRCRFGNVSLTPEGIRTSGRLWKSKQTILPEPLQRKGDKATAQSILTKSDQRQLRAFAAELRTGTYGQPHAELADGIDEQLNRGSDDLSWLDEYRDIMAGEIVDGIQEGKHLLLARAVDPITGKKQDGGEYRAIFVDERPDEAGWDPTEERWYFTAESPAEEGTEGVNKHVSLEVEMRGLTKQGMPRLIIKRWANGLSFGGREEMMLDVVFPWPMALVV